MKKDRIACPVCDKDVALSFPGEIIQRHASAIARLNGLICSASGVALVRVSLDTFLRSATQKCHNKHDHNLREK